MTTWKAASRLMRRYKHLSRDRTNLEVSNVDPKLGSNLEVGKQDSHPTVRRILIETDFF